MATHQYFQVMDIDELKRACPSLNFDNCVLMGDSSVIQLGSQDQQLLFNEGHLIYQQPQQNQITQQQYVIQEDDIQSDGSFASQAGQIFFAADSIDINQQHQQINEVQQNLQTALIEPSQHIQTDAAQQQMVMHYQSAPQSQQQIIVEHSSPSSSQAQQHHVIVQQNITPPHQQTIHQSQPIVITSPPQNVVRQPYTVYNQTPQKRIFQTVSQNVQMRAVPIVEQSQQPRLLQLGQQSVQKVPRLVSPSHVQAVQTNPMPRVRVNRPRAPSVTQQTQRLIVQPGVRQPRHMNPGIIRQANVNQNALQNQRAVQNIRPHVNPYRGQGQTQIGQSQMSQALQQRLQAPVLQRIGTPRITPCSTAPTISVTKKTLAAQQKSQIHHTKPQYATESKSSTTSTDLNELEDLENSITAAKIPKTQPDLPSQNAPVQNVASTQYVAQHQQSTSSQLSQKTSFLNQQRTQSLNSQQNQQPYLHNPSLEDARKVVTLRTGEILPLAEYKRKIHDSQYSVQPQQQLQNQPQAGVIQPTIRGNATRGRGSIRGSSQSRGSNIKRQYRPQSHQQLQQQNLPDQTQHIIESEARESAKMLVVLQSGEQRLITFTLPKESCTVQELLEQVGVPFTDHTNIECVTNPGVSIDYLVTVGVTCSGTPSEIISAAENTLQMKQLQQQQQQLHQQQQQQQQTQQQFQAQSHLPAQQHDKSQLQQLHQQQKASVASQKAIEAQNVLGKQKAPEQTKSPPPKIVLGFLAVCPNCGVCSMDHYRCERCKVVFKDEVKVIPSSGNDQPMVKSRSNAIPSLVATEKQRKEFELLQKKSQISVADMKNTFVSRGRGGVTAGRGRGRPKPKLEEPVILTLISDDEEDYPVDASTGKAVPPLDFDPKPEQTNVVLQDFVRKKVTDNLNVVDEISTSIQMKAIRIGSYKFEPEEKVIFSSIGMRIIAPNIKGAAPKVILDIQKEEMIKIISHLSKSLCVLFIYTTKSCGSYIRDSLEMVRSNGAEFYYDPTSSLEYNKRIILLMDSITEEARSTIKSIFPAVRIDEIKYSDAVSLLETSTRNLQAKSEVNTLNSSAVRQILIYPPPQQAPGGISINTEDYECLAMDQYLNDVIIDFYLKYLQEEMLTDAQRSRTHIFSQFFYKRLTTMARKGQTEKDVKLTASQRRHSRVTKWTKSVNLFNKDYIIIPINEQQHWFLAIICFPGMTGPVTYDGLVPIKPVKYVKKRVVDRKNITLQIGNTTITPVTKREQDAIYLADESEKDEAEGDDSDVASDDDDDDEVDPSLQNIKQPCILIFDSLAGTSRTRVVATLRDYLTCEYRTKLGDSNSRVFNKDNMPNYTVKVPQQNNFTDCGLYLLQYVEQFFKDPIKDYRLPVINKQLSNWFDGLVVTRKREDISDLLKKLVHRYNPNNLPLPDIPLPTLNGELVETEDHYNENDEMGDFEEEELEDEDSEEVSVGGISPEKIFKTNDSKTSNGTTRILFKRTQEDRTEHIAPKCAKYDKFDELKNSN